MNEFFFLFWKTRKDILQHLSDNYKLDTERGKLMMDLLQEYGRKMFRSRGVLFVNKKENSHSVADLLCKNNGVLPFYLFLTLKKVVEEKFFDDTYLLKSLKKMHSIALYLCSSKSDVIKIVFKKMRKKFYKIDINSYSHDLFIEGFIGLLNAVYGFVATKKVKFETYAFYWCQKYMLAYITKFVINNSYEYNDKIRVKLMQKI